MVVTDTFIQRVKAQLSQPDLAFVFACDCFVHGPDPTEERRGRKWPSESQNYLFVLQKTGSKPLRKNASWTKDVGQTHEKSGIDLIL